MIFNQDCMELMRSYPDKHFDLAVVDPPYGIGMDEGAGETRGNGKKKADLYKPKSWDTCRPSREYFQELRRCSRNQIIFGGNYFADLLPASRGWIYWRKLMGGDYADGELAWTSFDVNLKEFTKRPQQGDRIHPTQKPIELYAWIFQRYAKPGWRILDTHLGSGSSAIAAHYAGLDFTGCEIDEDYFKAASKRIADETAQLCLF